MMRFLLLFLLASIICCTDTVIPTVRYEYIKNQNTEKEVFVDIDSYSNYLKLYSRVQDIICNDSIPVIKIRGEKHVKQIYPLQVCWRRTSCLLIRARNALAIHNNEIVIDQKYKIDKIESLVYAHYCNYGVDFRHSTDLRKAIIRISYDDNTSPDSLHYILDRLTDAYDKTKISEPIIISLERRAPPPPPAIPNGHQFHDQ